MGTLNYSLKPSRSLLRRIYGIKILSRQAHAPFLARTWLITYCFQEWHGKCLTSQELIAAQIPWATAGADRSRAAREAQQQQLQQQRTIKRRNSPNGPGITNAVAKSPRNKQGNGEDSPVELTAEEQLLGELLEANGALTSVLRDYDDIERIGIERETLERSRQEVRLDRTVCRLWYHAFPTILTSFCRGMW